jgi:protein SCO1/2
VNRRTRLVVAVVAAVAFAVAGCSSSGGKHGTPAMSELNDQTGSSPYSGVGLDPAQPRPSFTLTDTSGKTFAFGQQTAGRPTLLFFGYTNCPDECPATMADIGLALKSLPSTLQRQVDVVFVTTDVKHDTGATIHTWLATFAAMAPAATFIGLRGSQAQIDAAQTAAHVTLAEDGGETHSTQVLLYGADDYARVSFLRGDNEQKQIAHDLPLVART